MFNQLNTNLTDALPADFLRDSPNATLPAERSGLGPRFATELNRSVLSRSTAPEATGSGLPASGNALPSLSASLASRQSIEADLAGMSPDVLQSIYSDLGELAELSGGSSLIVDDAIARHDELFSAQALGLSGTEALAVPAGSLPGEASLTGPVLPGALNLQQTVPAHAGAQSAAEQPTAGFQPPGVADGDLSLQATDRALDRLERTLQAVAGHSRIHEQTVRSVAQNVPLVDAEALDGRAGPKPAPVINVDGNLSDSERFRFRPVGLTPTLAPGVDPRLEASTDASRTLTTDAVSRFESIGVLSDGLRTDASLLNKPAAGGFQVHAPSNPQTVLPNTASVQPGPGGLTLSDTVQTAVQDQAWGERIGERVALMANNRLQNAELRLTPAELGPLRVKVSIEDGLANVSFVAQNAVTRDAIEQAMPRLREMLEQQGINLGQSSVDEQGSNTAFADGGENADGGSDGSRESGSNAAAHSPDQPAIATSPRRSNNLLDTFV